MFQGQFTNPNVGLGKEKNSAPGTSIQVNHKRLYSPLNLGSIINDAGKVAPVIQDGNYVPQYAWLQGVKVTPEYIHIAQNSATRKDTKAAIKAIERGKYLDTRMAAVNLSGMVQPRIASGVEVALQGKNINPRTPLLVKGAIIVGHARPTRGRFGSLNTIPLEMANRIAAFKTAHSTNENSSNANPTTHAPLLDSITRNRKFINNNNPSVGAININPNTIADTVLRKQQPFEQPLGISTATTRINTISSLGTPANVKGKAKPV